MRKRNAIYSLVVTASLLPAIANAADASDKVGRFIVPHDDARIETLAQGQGPVIVMLPSLGRSGEDYDQVAAKLAADGFRVLRPQPRGIGQSQGPMDNLNMHALAADVAAVVEHEQKGKVVVIGHAFGNFVARQLAADRPDLVQGVVLAAASAGKVPAGSTEVPIGPEIRKAIDCPSNASLSEATRLECLRKAFFAPGHDPSIWLGGWNEAVHHMESWAREHTPVDDYFAAGRAPILDLQAEDDPVGPRRFSKVLQSMLGDRVTVVVIPNASHALFPEQPDAVAGAIATFARRVFANSSQ
jgi:pimeloyl-ACP methyl ester carboxylesterase